MYANSFYKLTKYLKQQQELVALGRIGNDTNSFNFYHNRIGTDLAAGIGLPLNPGSFAIPNNPTSFCSYLTDPAEVMSLIFQLKNKSGGLDHINSIVLKKISKYISKPLSKIINKCITTGCYPDYFKIAEIVPTYKSKDTKAHTNYRPISLIAK